MKSNHFFIQSIVFTFRDGMLHFHCLMIFIVRISNYIPSGYYFTVRHGKSHHKWRFLAGKIIYFYGPSMPWLAICHNQRVIFRSPTTNHSTTESRCIPPRRPLPSRYRGGHKQTEARSLHGPGVSKKIWKGHRLVVPSEK